MAEVCSRPATRAAPPRGLSLQEQISTEAGGHVTYRPLGTTAGGFEVWVEEDVFRVRGRAVRRLVNRFDLTNEEAIRYLGERLDRLGVYDALRARGAQPGDEVEIEGYTFEFR